MAHDVMDCNAVKDNEEDHCQIMDSELPHTAIFLEHNSVCV